MLCNLKKYVANAVEETVSAFELHEGVLRLQISTVFLQVIKIVRKTVACNRSFICEIIASVSQKLAEHFSVFITERADKVPELPRQRR